MLFGEAGWQAHPSQEHTWIKSWQGIWHSVLPDILIKVVLIKRDKPVGQQKLLEALFSTDPATSSHELFDRYTRRWDVEINIRDTNALYGFGQDQCQSYRSLGGVNPAWSARSELYWLLAVHSGLFNKQTGRTAY